MTENIGSSTIRELLPTDNSLDMWRNLMNRDIFDRNNLMNRVFWESDIQLRTDPIVLEIKLSQWSRSSYEPDDISDPNMKPIVIYDNHRY